MTNGSPFDARIFQVMVEQTRDYALFMLDPQGNVATWNQGAQLIKGYQAEEIIGRHFSTFYTHDSVVTGWPQHELRVATVEGRFEDEGWRVRKDGSRFWAGVVITAVRDADGKLLGFAKITRDLTDRKAHDEELRQSEERFRLLLEGVVDYAIYMVDAEGMVTSWNTGAERITGYARKEILGRHCARFYTPEEITAGRPWNDLAVARRLGRAEDEGWRVKKSGERFWARVVISALHDGDNQLHGFAKVIQDLSERSHMQDLEKATKNVNAFIATLAHELRNPLAPIRSAALILPSLLGDETKLRTVFGMIDRQSAHLTRILDDMLDIAQVSRGSLSMQLAPVDLAQIVARSLEAAAPLIEEMGHRVEVDLPQPTAWVHGDCNRLVQLLTNLLNNAARYTPQGGRITVRGDAEDSRVNLRVADNGRGISAQQIEMIFDMFVQGSRLHGAANSGLGIGLALARKIAELHGGTLVAHSAGEGLGAEFTVSLPRVDAPEAAEPSEAPTLGADPAIPAQRILIVDDNVDAADMLQQLLQSLGHSARVVTDSTCALPEVKSFAPDVVLLDIAMPGLDGYEVARRLRQHCGERLRIVALSGFHEEAGAGGSREAGFDLHLVKPVGIDGLARALGSDGTAA